MAGADEIPIPALLRAARGAYTNAVRKRLLEGGFDDLPRNGPFLLGGMANRGGTPALLVRELGVSKQAASELIDTLVVRGYLERGVDPDDRRRMTLEPTERGRAAAAAVRAGVESVDAQLGAAEAGLRAGLLRLIEVREAAEDAARG